MLDDVESVRELAVADRRTCLDGPFQQQEQVFGALQGIGFAFQLDPPFARGRLDAELLLDRLQVARVVVVKLLREAGVFEVEGFGGPGGIDA